MATIAHTMPLTLAPAPATRFGLEYDDRLTTTSSGRVLARRRGRRPALTMTIQNRILSLSGAEDLKLFLERVIRDGGHFWVVDPISRDHRDLLCSPMADGTRTTFQIGLNSVVSTSDVMIMVNGIPQDPSTYTIHEASTLCDYSPKADGEELMEGDNTTRVLVDGHGVTSTNSTKATSNGTTTGAVRLGWFPVTLGQQYTIVSVTMITGAPTDDYAVIAMWGSSTTPSWIGSTIGTTTQLEVGKWVALSESVTPAVAGTGNAIIGTSRRTTSGVVDFYVGAIALCPGTYSTWHRPDGAPALVEFASAPAAGSVITSSGEGKRVTRMALDPGAGFRYTEGGLFIPETITATESPEVDNA